MFKVKNILEEKKNRLLTVPIDATVGETVLLMKEENIGALMVADANGSLVGILSERDLVYGLEGSDGSYLGIPVANLMSCNVQTCAPDDTISHVAKTMGIFRIRHLPVLDGAELAGIISIRDVEDFRNKESDLKIERLIESNEGYTRFLQKCPDAIYIQVDGKIVFANSKANEIFGAKYGNHLIGSPSLELIHPDSRDIVRDRQSVRVFDPEITGG